MGARPSVPQRAYNDDASTPLTRALGRPATRNEVSTARPDETAVVQALEFLNGEEYHRRVYAGGFVEALRVVTDPEDLVRQMYWSALNRAPTTEEVEAGAAFVLASSSPTTTPASPTEVVWLDDGPPPGAQLDGTWQWAGAPQQPVFSGTLSHKLGDEPAGHGQHKLSAARFTVAPGDVLVAHVYIDPQRPPRQMMLQWHAKDAEKDKDKDRGWDHRATWGGDELPFTPRTSRGPLPATGQWVRLEIPAHAVGFTRETTIDGISFDQVGGVGYWDKTGVVHHEPVHPRETIGDMLWALLSGAEFHYVK